MKYSSSECINYRGQACDIELKDYDAYCHRPGIGHRSDVMVQLLFLRFRSLFLHLHCRHLKNIATVIGVLYSISEENLLVWIALFGKPTFLLPYLSRSPSTALGNSFLVSMLSPLTFLLMAICEPPAYPNITSYASLETVASHTESDLPFDRIRQIKEWHRLDPRWRTTTRRFILNTILQ